MSNNVFEEIGAPEVHARILDLPQSRGVIDPLVVGDFNGDGFGDLIIAASMESTSDFSVYVVLGGSLLEKRDYELNSLVDVGQALLIHGKKEPNATVLTMTVGDINGDGFDDVIIGNGNANASGVANSGIVYVVYGRSAPMRSPIELSANQLSSDYTQIIGKEHFHLGRSVACADIDGDGFDDIVVGAPGAEPDDYVRASNKVGAREWDFVPDPATGGFGAAYVVYGASNLPGRRINTGKGGDTKDFTRILGPREDSFAGHAVTASDINGDGLADIIVSAGGSSRGEVLIHLGSKELPGSHTQLVHSWCQKRMLGDHRNDHWGWVVGAGGDMNRDGFGDYVGTAPRTLKLCEEKPCGGYAKVIFGAGTATSATSIARFQAGDTQQRGFGGRLSPVLRAWLAFSGGDAISPVTATITRSSAGIAQLSGPADVVWEFQTPRTGWSSARIRLQYTDKEITGLDEDNLQLYQAPSLNGPWIAVAGAVHDAHKNEFRAEVTSLGFFALGQFQK
jgi:hypothetical protein